MTQSSSPRLDVHNDVIAQLGESSIDHESVDAIIRSSVNNRYPLMSTDEKSRLISSLIHDVTGYGFLEELLNDESVNEIMINSSSTVYLDKAGVFHKVDIQTTNEELVRLVQKIAGSIGARCDVSSPIVDAWLDDGSRMHAVLPPIAADGPYITIRRFIARSFELHQFCEDESQERSIRDIISCARNVIVAGGTSSGKTTLLNCMIHHVDKNQRVVSIEETAELHTDHPHCVRLLARAANSEGAGAVCLGDLVKASLRMRPDRIVVGEVRGKEAFDLVQALNTGHDGSLCTIHANGPREVIHRLASLAVFAQPGLDYQAILTQVVYGIDTIIFVKKSTNGRRVINSISRIQRDENHFQILNTFTGETSYV